MFIITYTFCGVSNQNVAKVEKFKTEELALARQKELKAGLTNAYDVVLSKVYVPPPVTAKVVEAEFRKDLTELVKAYSGNSEATPNMVFKSSTDGWHIVLPALYNSDKQLVRKAASFLL